MNRRGNVAVSVLLGVMLASLLGLTTDQILNNVFISGSNALRVTAAGGSFVSPAGNVNDIQIKASATALGAYAGANCAPTEAIQDLSSAGAPSCVTLASGTVGGTGTTGLIPNWSAATTLADSLAYRISVTNDTVTGTTVNKLAKFTSAGRAIITSAAETSGVLGIIHSGAGTSGSAIVTTLGAASCVSDNATTAGHYATVSASTAGSCSDTGAATFPVAGTQVIGIWTETGAAGTRTMFFNTPDVASASSGGGGGGAKNPGGAAGDVQYRDTGNNFAAEAAFNYSASTDNLILANAATSANNTLSLNSTTQPTGNRAYVGVATGAATGDNYGGVFQASGTSGRNIAMYAKAAGTAAGDNIAVLGNAANSTEGTNLKNVGVYGTLNSSPITATNGSFAGLFDAGTLATAGNDNVIRGRGTAPASPSAGITGYDFGLISAGSASQEVNAVYFHLDAGYTGSSRTFGAFLSNAAAGTGANLSLNGSGGAQAYNVGIQTNSSASTAGINVGIIGGAQGSTVASLGVYGSAVVAAAGTNIGVLGNATASTEGTNLKNIGGWFTLGATSPAAIASNTSVALGVDTSGSEDSQRWYDNGALVATMADGGAFSTASTIKSTAASDLGWTVQNAANQACNTTCTTGACVVGVDTVTTAFLACTDASSDSCLCAG